MKITLFFFLFGIFPFQVFSEKTTFTAEKSLSVLLNADKKNYSSRYKISKLGKVFMVHLNNLGQIIEPNPMGLKVFECYAHSSEAIGVGKSPNRNQAIRIAYFGCQSLNSRNAPCPLVSCVPW